MEAHCARGFVSPAGRKCPHLPWGIGFGFGHWAEEQGENFRLDQLKIKPFFPIKMINFKGFQCALLIGVDKVTTLNHLCGQAISMLWE